MFLCTQPFAMFFSPHKEKSKHTMPVRAFGHSSVKFIAVQSTLFLKSSV